MNNNTRTYKDYKEAVLEQLKKGLSEDPHYLLKIANHRTPYNPVRDTYYVGINYLWCTFVAMKMDWKDTRWYTFKDIYEVMGKSLKAKDPSKGYQKGDQKATELMYFIPHFLYDMKENGEIDWMHGKRISEAEYQKLTDEEKKRCKAKTIKFWVFNGEQVEGLEPEYREDKHYSVDLANHIASSIKTTIEWDSDKEDPCYSSKTDKVYMPDSNAFDNENEMNAVAFHELSHATGHESRLARSLGNRFGSEAYAFEELIAECSATMLCAYLGIEPIVHDNHKAYVNSWLGALNNDPNALLDAFKMAEKAQQYIIDTAHLETYGESVAEQEAEPATPTAQEVETAIKETAKRGRPKAKKSNAPKQIASLEGLNIVITGKLDKFGRKTAFTLIKSKGGTPSDSLTKSTNILVVADEKMNSKTDKIKKAEKYGTKIMTEKDFYSLVLA